MKVNVGIYETPQSFSGRETEKKLHARVQSNGIRRLTDICDTLVEKGINSAQIKAVLDGIAIYIGKSLRDGYTVEMEEVGIFSLSVGTKERIDEEGQEIMTVGVNGVNFRCSPILKRRISEAQIRVNKERLKEKMISLEKRKSILIRYLEKNSFIHVLGYSQLISCSRYQAEKDLKIFQDEGILKIVELGRRNIYTRV